MSINERYAEVFETLASTAGATGKYDSMLDQDVREDLDRFVDWLRTQNKTDATSRSYRSYCAKYFAIGGKLTSDQKSAMKAFKTFITETTS